ncbi:hypothetical protein [Methanosarcina siciliae]|uniref:hypothetical protein n=1 Tax=Methanosarcina siciliae TaxID=38027 RepID=UPI00064E82B9|nr:hypothetical protein [Methanosarcina siciliae]
MSNKLIGPVRIPFENTTLPDYLCLVDADGEKRPLLIVQTGYDCTGEELYFQVHSGITGNQLSLLNGGVYDFGGSILQRVSPDIEDVLSDENKSKAFLTRRF